MRHQSESKTSLLQSIDRIWEDSPVFNKRHFTYGLAYKNLNFEPRTEQCFRWASPSFDVICTGIGLSLLDTTWPAHSAHAPRMSKPLHRGSRCDRPSPVILLQRQQRPQRASDGRDLIPKPIDDSQSLLRIRVALLHNRVVRGKHSDC
jgi:hypothetical protein